MKKTLFIIPVTLAGITLVACGNKPTPTPVVKEYDVSLKMTEALAIDKAKAISNEDFDTQITVKEDFTNYCEVPEALQEVFVGGNAIEPDQYTYTRDSKDLAHLHIPSDLVTGEIEINTVAKADTIEVSLLGEPDDIELDSKNTVVGSSFATNISLVKDHEIKSLPEKLDSKSIICNDAHDQKTYDLTPCCTYIKNDDYSASLIIPAKYNGVVVITGNISIKMASYQPTYAFEAGDELHNLEITPPNAAPTKGTDYSFNIKASTGYKIPSTLDISVGGVTLVDGYEITSTQDDEGSVKIDAEKVNGDIIVNGEGVLEQAVPVKYYLGGIVQPETEGTPVSQDFVCELVAEEGHVAPKANDVRILIGDHKDANNWIIPNDGSGVTFDDTTSTLTIPGSKIESTSDTIHVAAKADDVKLLEFYSSQGDWASIESAANMGYAEYLFEIGEESVPFTLNDGTNDSYRIRILGFNKDKNYLYENKAGITFEFTTGVSEQYFGKSVSGKTYSSYYYKNGSETGYQSDLYDYLNTTLYNALPFKKYINNTRKYTVAGSFATVDADKEKIMESGNYLFPLSLREMGLDSTISGEFNKEGPSGTSEAYPYYANGGSLVKTDGTDSITYWLRSPANIKNPQIYTINTSGARASAPARGQKLYVAPAFCF